MIWYAVGLVIVGITVYMIYTVLISAFNPYENIAFANTEKLRSAINEACLSSRTVRLDNFNLRQNMPIGIGTVSLFTEIFPKIAMNQYGDPRFVLYYEAFPPGEAVGWEVYQKQNYRLFTPLTDSPESAVNLNGYATDQLDRFLQSRPGADVDAVLVNNIILNAGRGYKGEYLTESYLAKKGTVEGFVKTSSETSGSLGGGGGGGLGAPTIKQSFSDFGKWKYADDNGNPLPGDNIFLFNNYGSLTTLQQSLVKYMPCGENSLCLKTTKGVYRYPLSECSGIKNIQVIYDARNRVGGWLSVGGAIVAALVGAKLVGVAAFGTFFVKLAIFHPLITAGGATLVVAEVGEYFGNRFLAFKTSDLNIASPCTISGKTEGIISPIEIKVGKCAEIEVPGKNIAQCTQVVSYPLYTYNSDKGLIKEAENDGRHYVCLEKARINLANEVEDKNYGPDDNCVQIHINEKANGCWTPDPYKEDADSDTQAIAALVNSATDLSVFPISESLDNVNPAGSLLGRIIALRPSNEESLNQFVGLIDEKASWGWPWPR
jgi:hypothetical protein